MKLRQSVLLLSVVSLLALGCRKRVIPLPPEARAPQSFPIRIEFVPSGNLMKATEVIAEDKETIMHQRTRFFKVELRRDWNRRGGDKDLGFYSPHHAPLLLLNGDGPFRIESSRQFWVKVTNAPTYPDYKAPDVLKDYPDNPFGFPMNQDQPSNRTDNGFVFELPKIDYSGTNGARIKQQRWYKLHVMFRQPAAVIDLDPDIITEP